MSSDPNYESPISDDKNGVNNLQLFILFSAVFIDLMGFGIIIPILPILNENLGGNSFDYGLIIAIYSFMQFIFSPIWGSISDRIGRKPVIIIGLGGSAIGFGLFGFAYDLWILYVARAIAGIFTAATLTTSNAYIADVTPPEKRGGAFGIITAAFGLGFAVGPGLGGILSDYTGLDYLLVDLVPIMGSHVVPSFASAVLAIVSMFAAMVFLPESLEEKLVERIEGRSRFPILDTFKYRHEGDTLFYIFVFAFIAFGLSSFITAFPQFALAIDDSVEAVALGFYFTFIGIILFVVQTFFIRYLIKKFGEALLVKSGLTMMIFGFFVVTLSPNFVFTFFPNTFFTLGIAIVLPTMNSLISNSAAAEDQGNVMGISQGWSAFMRVMGPVFAGFVFQYGVNIPFYVAGFLYLVILIIVFQKIDESPGKISV